MKKLSKWLTSLLVIAMALSMFGTTAFAEDENAAAAVYTANQSTVNVTKTISGLTEATQNLVNTADVYTFKMDKVKYESVNPSNTDLAVPTDSNVSGFTDGETIDISGINFAAQSNNANFGTITFSAPGIYTYKVTESASTNTNLTKATNHYTVQVTVVYATVNNVPTTNLVATTVIVPGDDITVTDGVVAGKVDTCTFDNSYDSSNTSSVAITKTVNGNTGDAEKYFKFTIDLTGVTGQYAISYSGTANGTHYSATTNPQPVLTTAAGTDHTSSTTIWLKHGQTATVTGLPKTATYTTAEVNVPAGYTSVATGAQTGTLTNSAAVTYTNTSNIPVPTAFVMNNWPYIALGIFAIAAIAIVLKKKSTKETF